MKKNECSVPEGETPITWEGLWNIVKIGFWIVFSLAVIVGATRFWLGYFFPLLDENPIHCHSGYFSFIYKDHAAIMLITCGNDSYIKTDDARWASANHYL